MNKNILIGLIYCFFGQILVWFQVNGQFVWDSWKRQSLFVSLITGPIVSLIFIYGVRFIRDGTEGQIWAGRLLPAATGTIVYTLMTWIFMKQGIDIKIGICIILSIIIMLIQIYWK